MSATDNALRLPSRRRKTPTPTVRIMDFIMFKTTSFSACVALGLATLAAPFIATAAPAALNAAEAKKFFNDKGCNGCHGLDEHRLGPSFQAVSLRYSAEYSADAAARIDKLAVKIREGGAGAWGVVPMISDPRLSDAEARAIARWILELGQSAAAAAAQ